MQIQSVSPINYNKQVKIISKSRQNTYQSEPITTGDESTSKSTNFMNKNNISFGLSANASRSMIGAGIIISAALFAKVTDTTSSGNPETRTPYEERIQAQNDVSSYINSSDLLRYESMQKYMGMIINDTKTEEEANAKIGVMECIKNYHFFETQDIEDDLIQIINDTKTEEEANAKIGVMAYIRNHVTAIGSIKKYIASITSFTKNQENADGKITLMEYFESKRDLSLWKIKSIIDARDNIINHTFNTEEASAKMDVMNGLVLMKDSGLLDNVDTEWLLHNIINDTNTEEEAKARTTLMKYFVSMKDSGLFKTTSIKKEKLSTYIYNTEGQEGANAKMDVMNYLESKINSGWVIKRLLSGQLDKIITFTDTQSDADTKIKAFDHLFATKKYWKYPSAIKEIAGTFLPEDAEEFCKRI